MSEQQQSIQKSSDKPSNAQPASSLAKPDPATVKLLQTTVEQVKNIKSEVQSLQKESVKMVLFQKALDHITKIKVDVESLQDYQVENQKKFEQLYSQVQSLPTRQETQKEIDETIK